MNSKAILIWFLLMPCSNYQFPPAFTALLFCQHWNVSLIVPSVLQFRLVCVFPESAVLFSVELGANCEKFFRSSAK